MSLRTEDRAVALLGATCALAVVAVVAVTYFRAGTLFNLYDDAYITLRYARNLATGNGLVFNVGQPTDAASSLLYTLALAACYRAGVHNLEAAAVAIGLAALGSTVAVVYRSCLARAQHVAVAAFLATATGLCGMVSGWATTGMETPLFVLLVTANVHRLFVRQSLDWWTAVLVCLAFLARLEGSLLVVAYLILIADSWRQAPLPDRSTCARQAGLVVFVVAGFVALKLHLYGTAVPHAFKFKTVSLMYRPNTDAVWSTWTSMALGLLVLGASGLVMGAGRARNLVLGGYVVASVLSVLVGPSADYARYSVHLVPVFAVMASLPLARIALLSPTLALAICALVGVQSERSYDEMVGFARGFSPHQACRRQVGRYIEEQIKPKTPVISSDIGGIAYAAPSASFIDTIALTSSDILGRRTAGAGVDDILERASEGYVADTCHGPCRNFADYLAQGRLVDENAWRSAVPESRFGNDFQPADALFICHTSDGLGFAVSRFPRH